MPDKERTEIENDRQTETQRGYSVTGKKGAQ